jgi:Fe-S-cluster-containing dehydrogenase component
MQYGFVIDHTACIGCHACTVACKAENDVPVGSFRTSVKYTEIGTFPDIKRHFAVQRCNHCSDAPCVTICPVKALEKRPDGIVDIDRDACIGCRACMQACPYDAIYLNDDHGAVEKCHYCAHRVERNLEPACVNVCPVNAIISGDLEDPASRISLMVLNNQTQVRRPEQETGPNVHYVGADDVSLHPGRAERPETYLWSDRPRLKPEAWPDAVPTEAHARVVLDDDHRVEWGWGVAAYLVTKGIAAGAAMLAPLASPLGLTGPVERYGPEAIALVFVLITLFLLVEDLTRPLRFYRLLTRPNWRSWLVRGGVILGVFTATTAAALGLRAIGADAAVEALRWVNAVLGLGVAGYTAFLFAQCKGRDLWESPILLPHLIVQAALCGAASLLAVAPGGGPLVWIVIGAALGHGGLALWERARPHETDNARQAAGFLGSIRLGPLQPYRDGLLLGVAAAIVVVLVAPTGAWIPVLGGLLLYEHAFVRAGQLPPLS